MSTTKKTIYAWGSAQTLEIDNYIYEQNLLDSDCYDKDNTSVKLSIVLHCTAGNNIADKTVQNTWNSEHLGAHFILERYLDTAQRKSIGYKGIDSERMKDRQAEQPPLVQRITEELKQVYHAGPMNKNSIGIEIVNAATEWSRVTKDYESTFDNATS